MTKKKYDPEHWAWQYRLGWKLDRLNRLILRQGRGAVAMRWEQPFKFGPRIERYTYDIGANYGLKPQRVEGAWLKIHFGHWYLCRPLSLRRQPTKYTDL